MGIQAIMSLPQLRVLRRGQHQMAAGISGAQSRPGQGRSGASVDSEPGPQGRGCRGLQAELSCSPQRKGETKAMKAREGKRGRDREGEEGGRRGRERARGGRRETRSGRGREGRAEAEDYFAQLPEASGFQDTELPGSQPIRRRRDPALALLRPRAWPSLSELLFPCLEKGPELSLWGSQGFSYMR